MLPETVMQNGQNLPRHFDVILGHVDRFETGQKALTPAPAGTAAQAGPATALASPGTSQTELIRVFYAVLYPDFTHTGGILANCHDDCAPLRDEGLGPSHTALSGPPWTTLDHPGPPWTSEGWSSLVHCPPAPGCTAPPL